MIQIIKLRSGMADTGIRVSDPRDLFTKNLASQFHEDDRYNLFFTTADCSEGEKARIFESLRLIYWDIDKIGLHRPDKIFTVACKILGIDPAKSVCVASGHGVHIYCLLPTPLFDKTYFQQVRNTYKFVATTLEAGLLEAGLNGKVDTQVWDSARVMRLPFTINRKPNLEDVAVTVVQGNLEEQENPLTRWAKINSDTQMDPELFQKYPTPDTKGVLEGCEFLKWCAENPAEVSEPQWFSEVGIVSFLPNGAEIMQARAAEDKARYSHTETAAKIEAASKGGPHTCKKVAEVSDKCKTCKFNGKLTSPIQIVSEDYIQTKDKGFYFRNTNAQGVTKLTPDYEGLIKYFKKTMNPIRIGERFYFFDSEKYKLLDRYGIEGFAMDNFNPQPSAAYMKEFKGRILANIKSPFTQEELEERNRGFINFKNGILNTRTLSLMPHSPKYFFRGVLPYNYDKDARCLEFDKFINEITQGDNQCQQSLLEFSGYCLSGDRYWHQKALVLYGPTAANGKSTFTRILQRVVGKENYSTVSVKDFNDGNRAVLMDGKLMNVSEETPDYAMKHPDTFKKVTGEGEILGYMKYVDTYSFVSRAKIVMTCNTLPDSYDKTNALVRRLLIIPFNRKFEEAEYDYAIDDKLNSEKSGIFNKMLAAYKEAVSRGTFTTPDKSIEQLKEYREDNDMVLQFVNEKLTVLKDYGQDDFCQTSELYEKFRVYHESYGSGKCMGRTHFLKTLGLHIPDLKTKRCKVSRINGKIVRGTLGILIDEPLPET